MRPGDRIALALGVGAACLPMAGCESIPAPGAQVQAEVVAIPKDRADLQGGFTHLHAALRAGVQRADAERDRLWLAQCVEPDAGAPGRVRSRTVTLLVPGPLALGVAPGEGALVEIEALQGAHATDRHRHGRLTGVEAPAGPAASDAPGWRRDSGRLRPVCRPEGAAEGRWRVQLHRTVSAWEIDFAMAERARHESLTDAELAAGRVVVARCQLKVVDGSHWTRPSWIARLPQGQAARVGDLVQLRTGAEEAGRATAPLAQVLGPGLRQGVARPQAPGVVRCNEGSSKPSE